MDIKNIIPSQTSIKGVNPSVDTNSSISADVYKKCEKETALINLKALPPLQKTAHFDRKRHENILGTIKKALAGGAGGVYLYQEGINSLLKDIPTSNIVAPFNPENNCISSITAESLKKLGVKFKDTKTGSFADIAKIYNFPAEIEISGFTQTEIIESEADLLAFSYLYGKDKLKTPNLDQQTQDLLKALDLSQKKGVSFFNNSGHSLSFYGIFKLLSKPSELKSEKFYIDNRDGKTKTPVKELMDLYSFLDSVIYPTKDELKNLYFERYSTFKDLLPEEVAEKIIEKTEKPDESAYPVELLKFYSDCMSLTAFIPTSDTISVNGTIKNIFRVLLDAKPEERESLLKKLGAGLKNNFKMEDLEAIGCKDDILIFNMLNTGETPSDIPNDLCEKTNLIKYLKESGIELLNDKGETASEFYLYLTLRHGGRKIYNSMKIPVNTMDELNALIYLEGKWDKNKLGDIENEEYLEILNALNNDGFKFYDENKNEVNSFFVYKKGTLSIEDLRVLQYLNCKTKPSVLPLDTDKLDLLGNMADSNFALNNFTLKDNSGHSQPFDIFNIYKELLHGNNVYIETADGKVANIQNFEELGVFNWLECGKEKPIGFSAKEEEKVNLVKQFLSQSNIKLQDNDGKPAGVFNIYQTLNNKQGYESKTNAGIKILTNDDLKAILAFQNKWDINEFDPAVRESIEIIKALNKDGFKFYNKDRKETDLFSAYMGYSYSNGGAQINTSDLKTLQYLYCKTKPSVLPADTDKLDMLLDMSQKKLECRDNDGNFVPFEAFYVYKQISANKALYIKTPSGATVGAYSFKDIKFFDYCFCNGNMSNLPPDIQELLNAVNVVKNIKGVDSFFWYEFISPKDLNSKESWYCYFINSTKDLFLKYNNESVKINSGKDLKALSFLKAGTDISADKSFSTKEKEILKSLKDIESNGMKFKDQAVTNDIDSFNAYLRLQSKTEFFIIDTNGNARTIKQPDDLKNVLLFPGLVKPVEGFIKDPVSGRAFAITKKIGSGAFGDVYRAVTEDGREVIIKQTDGNVPINLKSLQNEADILSSLDCKWIPKGQGFFKDEKGKYNLIMEWKKGVNLSDYFLRVNSFNDPLPYSIKDVCVIMREICRIFKYLQYQKPPIVYRDLKPENILISPKGDGKYEINLIDFGTAKLYDPNSPDTKDDCLGTPGHAAPEQFFGSNLGSSSPKSDIFALGVMLLCLLNRTKPENLVHIDDDTGFEKIKELKERYKTDHYLPFIPQSIHDAIEGTLQNKPSDRITIDELTNKIEIALAEFK